jgi:hypothetical protein
MTLATECSPGSIRRDAKKARAAHGEQQTNRTNGGVSSVARIYHWGRYGAPGEQ